MEVGRAGRAVLGYDPPRERCPTAMPTRVPRPFRPTPAARFRSAPTIQCRLLAMNLLQLCGQPLHQGGDRSISTGSRRMCGKAMRHDGRHHRPGTGEGRADHRQDSRRSRRRAIFAAWSWSLWKKIRDHGAEGPPHGPRHHRRGRYARGAGAALRLGRGDRFRRRGAEDAGRRSLPRFGPDGRRSAERSRSTTLRRRRTTR